MWLKPAKTTLFDRMAPWRFLIFIIWFSRLQSIFWLISIEMSRNWINNLCYNIVVLKKKLKLLKAAFLGIYLGKNCASMGQTQNKVHFFSGNNKRRSLAFTNFLFDQNICFDWVANDFLCVILSCKASHILLKQFAATGLLVPIRNDIQGVIRFVVDPHTDN